jgi:hypothetical protein
MSLVGMAATFAKVHPGCIFKGAMDRNEVRMNPASARILFEDCRETGKYPDYVEDFALDILVGKVIIKKKTS